MPTFQDREQAFEAKYAHDEEFRFRVIARRDKLFAHQAADRLAPPEQEAAGLAMAVLALRDGRGHDALLIRYMADISRSMGARTRSTSCPYRSTAAPYGRGSNYLRLRARSSPAAGTAGPGALARRGLGSFRGCRQTTDSG